MRIHFFSRTDLSGRSAFYSYYIFQNLKAVKLTCIVYFLFCVLVRILFMVYGTQVQTIAHIDSFNDANWLSLAITPLFYIASIYLISHYKTKSKFLVISQIFVFLFALYIITSGMRNSFFYMYNPRNTLLMYMTGLILVSIFLTFEYYETILITLITGLIFSIMLPFYIHSFNELAINNLASLLVLTVFYFISRYSFSYRADNFFKLKAINEKNIEIENTIQAKNEILSIVAHDLRNPLTIIKSVTSLLALDDGPGEDYHENLQLIRASCDKASSIINDLLETAQNEIVNEFALERIELSEFLTIIIDEWVQNKMSQVSISFRHAGQPVYAYVHKEKMQRVMDNLISNALKFSGKNDCIEITLHDTNENICIDVKDFGIGIPADLLPYIFDRFSKARRDGIRGEISIGLGLSIVQQIIKKHNGEIAATSTEENGTTFSIKLPNVKD
ncbi:sensor histidine kinase [Mucilaginibacter sp. X5P1]|uniref:sensor histidine kinase n=1 Tax=Mucilaginibacter sp. X5P1 TaxID=2723088 RepID=UPI0016104A7B|nr:HAMP domain-containing sensor histidine kinase [Mucilaginibacter sp. X5P1]MBB6141916.1 signal transduction histidine kinase [Mucilaginibacter sp. X5P1]